MANETITVSVGRGDPSSSRYLADGQWDQFCSDVHDEISASADEIYFRGTGQGTWTDAETNVRYQEDSATWAFSLKATDRSKRSNVALHLLKGELAELAFRYGQDAIALTVGTTEFIEPASEHFSPFTVVGYSTEGPF